MRNKKTGFGANRGSEDWNVLRISEPAGAIAVTLGRAMDPDGDGAQELFEERQRIRQLGGEVPTNLLHGSVRQHHAQEADLAKNEDRVTGAAAREEPRDQDIGVQTD